jgi:hypothetical protein
MILERLNDQRDHMVETTTNWIGGGAGARASKPRYSSEVKSHPGIVDDSLGFPANTALHFSLTLQ